MLHPKCIHFKCGYWTIRIKTKRNRTHTHTNCKNYMHVYELFGNNQNVNIHMKLIDALPFGKQTRRAIDWWVYIPEKKIHQDRLEIQAYTTLRIESVIDHFTYWLTKSWIGTSTYTWYVSSYFLFFLLLLWCEITNGIYLYTKVWVNITDDIYIYIYSLSTLHIVVRCIYRVCICIYVLYYVGVIWFWNDVASSDIIVRHTIQMN